MKCLVTAGFRVEPPIGIEPMTYALRGARSLTGHALAAALAWIIALTALAALGLSGMPSPQTVPRPRFLSCYCVNLTAGTLSALSWAGPCQQFPSAGKHADAQGVLERLAANAGV